MKNPKTTLQEVSFTYFTHKSREDEFGKEKLVGKSMEF